MLFALTLMLACPEPPSEAGQPNTATPLGGGAGQPGLPGEGAGQGPAPEAGPGPGGGSGGPPAYNSEVVNSQDDLSGLPDAITISGTLACATSEGPFVVHVFPPPPKGKAGEINNEPPQPVAGLTVKEPGEFSLKAPKGTIGMVLAFEDADENNTPSDAGIFFANSGQPVDLSGDLSVSLDCSQVAPPLSGDEAPEGPASPPAPVEAPDAQIEGGEMGPPPEGAEMGTPPEGGAQGPPPEGGAPTPGEAGPPSDGSELGPSGEPPAGGEGGPAGPPPEGAAASQ
ncbi:MAG: hypothetical protein ACI9VR_001138 [Cognaticolwellia sp.]|jgi:hypothetical protein